MATGEYDVFLSHAWADGDRPQQIAEALTQAGLRVWFDAAEIADFSSITRAVTEGLANSKALLAYYSATYPLRRACQWELTAAFLAAQSEGDPRRRVLVVNPESGPAHIHPIALRDAKFLQAPTSDGEMERLVEAIVDQVGQLTTPLADIQPLTAPNWYGIKPVGSTRFVGRLKEMWEIHSLLHAGDVAQITGAVSATGGIGQVQGLGGVGKSLLAEEYALHFGAAYPGGVFWLRAYGNDDANAALGPEERDALRSDQVRGIAERLGINAQGLTTDQVEGALAHTIGSEGKCCLWVVDDAPNGMEPDALRRWFAPHALARTLITTRSHEYGSLARGIDLSVLTPDEAHQLLTSRRPPAGEAEDNEARLLAEDLGRHALALDVTASALVSYGSDEPYHKFREELASRDDDALELATELADALPNGHERSIAQTMLRSIRHLGDAALDFLRLASVLAVAPIPASLVKAVFEKADGLDPGRAEQRQRKAFYEVTKASLAEIAGEKGEARTVHTLVSRAVRFHERAQSSRTQAVRSAAVEALTSETAQAAEDPRLHKQIELHVAHARQLVSIPSTMNEALLADWVARYDFKRGAYASARTSLEREFQFRRAHRGPEHPDTLTVMNNLAETLRAQGELSGARMLHEGALEIGRRELGVEHPNTLASMGSLGMTLRAQGDLPGARVLEEEVLAIRRRVQGPEHRNTLTAMNNLAATLQAEGDLRGARRLHEEALAIRRRVLGPEHPDTLRSMNNLAEILQAQGDLAGARKLQGRTLELKRSLLGPEHPDTLTSMSNLAATLEAQGDLFGARKLQEEVLEVRRHVLGLEHPDTLTSMNNLAETLRIHGDLAGARKLQEEVLKISRRVRGPEHPSTLTSMNNLGLTLRAQGDSRGARRLHEDTLALRRRVLGPEHPDTLSSMNNLAITLQDQGDLAGVRKLQEETLLLIGRVLGPEHPHTSISAWNLFLTLYSLGEAAAARGVLNRNLLWLLDRDPATLGANQRNIREHVAQTVKDDSRGAK